MRPSLVRRYCRSRTRSLIPCMQRTRSYQRYRSPGDPRDRARQTADGQGVVTQRRCRTGGLTDPRTQTRAGRGHQSGQERVPRPWPPLAHAACATQHGSRLPSALKAQGRSTLASFVYTPASAAVNALVVTRVPARPMACRVGAIVSTCRGQRLLSRMAEHVGPIQVVARSVTIGRDWPATLECHSETPATTTAP